MEKDSKMWLIGGLIVAVILIGIVVYVIKDNSGPGPFDSFAQCLKEEGAVFYGAFWCPHCQRTKAMFGSAAESLPYVECSTPDGKGQLQVCIDKKVESYPTWEFADGSRLTGERTLSELADKTQCALPEE